MRLTVREALRFGGLEDARVVAGEQHLDRLIESISVVEVAEPNVSNWLVKNEMYITSFYAIRNDIEMQKLVIRSLFDHGCCAIVICHVGMFFNTVDASVIELCDQLPIPLIIAKPETSYAQIIQPVFETLLMKDDDDAKTEELSTVRDDFLDLIINENDMQQVFKKMSRIIRQNISYYDISCAYIYSNKATREVDAEISHLKENFNSILDECEKNKYVTTTGDGVSRFTYLIRTHRNLFGFIVINYRTADELPGLQKIADALNVACSLTFSRQNKRADIKEQYFQEFLGDLLVWNFRDEEIAVKCGREFGVKLEDKDRIILININTIQQIFNHSKRLETAIYVKRYIFPNIAELVQSFNKNNLTVNRSDTIMIFLENSKADATTMEVARRVLSLFMGIGKFSVSIGISELFESPSNIPVAYNQAFSAAISGRSQYGENKITTWRDIWFYQVIKKASEDSEAADMCDALLRPLVQYDKHHSSDLQNTLVELLLCNNDISVAAGRLYVHRNTLLQRRNKIAEIYGYSPFDMPHLLNFLLAIKMLDK
ncbi:MAG: PucR family transcriptional regulator ligand-binding domain-containing protein [Defluviitaleaceae bacterium]|nr:PucR family transcriptional regulator ligand-binding domain-containing protein [Defluviitaleaceae bacterium]